MKDMNKIFYDILLKINKSNNDLEINKKLVLKYFESLEDLRFNKYELFAQYFEKFYHFCFELNHCSFGFSIKLDLRKPSTALSGALILGPLISSDF